MALLLAGIVTVQFLAVARQSTTEDEPYHLLAGHQALRYGRNTLNLEHPPLVKLVGALPSLWEEEPLAPELTVTEALAASAGLFRQADRMHRLRVRSRWAVLLVFGIPLLAACYGLGQAVARSHPEFRREERSAAGRSSGEPPVAPGSATAPSARAGWALVGLMGFSLAAVPYLSLLQTDSAVTLGATGLLWAGVLHVRRPCWQSACWIGLALGLAIAAKFSGVLFVPCAAVALVASHHAASSRWQRWRKRAVATSLAALVTLGVVYASYAVANRNYDPATGRSALRAYASNQGTLIVGDRLRSDEAGLLALERFSPVAAQWASGFLGIRAQNATGVYASYALGIVTSQGHWWYFPYTLLVKTPLVIGAALLAWSLGALRAWRRRRGRPTGSPVRRLLGRRELWVLGTGAGVYLAMAIVSNYNLGARHLLPVLPVVYLPAALWLARGRWRLPAALALLAVEAVVLTPTWISATNTWWLSSANPTRLTLAGSSGDFKQGFLALAEVVEGRDLQPVTVIRPGLTGAELAAYLPKARRFTPRDELTPGWYAVSVMLEQYVPAVLVADEEELYSHAAYLALAEVWQAPLDQLERAAEDHGYVAGIFHLSRLPEPAGDPR